MILKLIRLNKNIVNKYHNIGINKKYKMVLKLVSLNFKHKEYVF